MPLGMDADDLQIKRLLNACVENCTCFISFDLKSAYENNESRPY